MGELKNFHAHKPNHCRTAKKYIPFYLNILITWYVLGVFGNDFGVQTQSAQIGSPGPVKLISCPKLEHLRIRPVPPVGQKNLTDFRWLMQFLAWWCFRNLWLESKCMVIPTATLHFPCNQSLLQPHSVPYQPLFLPWTPHLLPFMWNLFLLTQHLERVGSCAAVVTWV